MRTSGAKRKGVISIKEMMNGTTMMHYSHHIELPIPQYSLSMSAKSIAGCLLASCGPYNSSVERIMAILDETLLLRRLSMV